MLRSSGAPVVAVFDDNEDTMAMLREWFEAAGMPCVTAAARGFDNERELAEFLATHRPDVIVVDIGLPSEPTWHCLQALHQLPEFSRLPVIITTTSQVALERLVGSTDPFAVLDKPYDLDALTAVVRRAVGGA